MHASTGEWGTVMLWQLDGSGKGAEQITSPRVLMQLRTSPQGSTHEQYSVGAQSSFTVQTAPAVPGRPVVRLHARRQTPGLRVLKPSSHCVTVKSQ
jgi:hypothetical protein